MRNTANNTCIFLVGETSEKSKQDVNTYIFGTAFFQSFWAQFAYVMPDMKMGIQAPMVVFSVQQKALA